MWLPMPTPQPACWAKHIYKTELCPHHQALAWLAPSMWFGIVWKQARFLGHISASGWKEMRHLCGIFWLRSVERCWEVWGTCAIYVGIPSLTLANEWDLRHLCPRKAAWCWGKLMGANQGRRLQKMSFLGTYMAQTTWWSIYPPALCSHLLWGGVHGQGLC